MLLILLLIITFIFVTNKDWYFRLLYFGNRQTINIVVIVDGKTLRPNKESLNLTCQTCDDKININTNNNLEISFRANEKNVYELDFSIDEYNFKLRIPHFTWWDVNKHNLEINIDTINKLAKYHFATTYLDDNGNKKEHYEEGEVDVSSQINIPIGVW